MVALIEVLLWDFCDTLIDGRWMHRAPAGVPDWPTVWTRLLRDRAHDWDTGRANESEIVGELVSLSGMDRSAVEEHFDVCCRSIKFRRAAWSAATERRCQQAMVTIIGDLFGERIEKPYRLDAHFDTIVASYREGTDDKVELCLVALDRLGVRGPRSRALLIDDRREWTEAWSAAGGTSYHVRDDASFEVDWPRLLR